jgi:hypothetical protein
MYFVDNNKRRRMNRQLSTSGVVYEERQRLLLQGLERNGLYQQRRSRR